MNLLMLTRQELEQNGYPLTAALTQPQDDVNDDGNSYLWDHPIRPQDISLAEAMSFVVNYQTKTKTMDPQIQLPPYVMAPCKSSSQSARERQIFAMDAEMVETHEGRELARITLVRLQPPPRLSGSHHQQQSSKNPTKPRTDLIFDVLVRPRNVVTNYWTQYSGVTAAMLHDDDPSNVVVQLEQVQAALLRTIHPDDILVGHSLENDLKATRFLHETVVDTAVIFQKEKGKKMALRHLAAVLLNRRIQQSDRAHCSEEDAVTALQLAVRRATEGPSFAMHSSPTPTNWLAELSSSSLKNSPNTVVTIGPSEWLERHVLSAPPNGVHALQCDSMHDGNAQALESWLTGPRRRAAVVYASFRLPSASRSTRNSTSVLSSTTEAPLHLPDVNKLVERLTSLLQKLPPEAILLLAIQPGYMAAHERTQLRAVRRNNPKATLGAWTESEEEEWRQLVQSCRMGSVLWVSK
jgi:DNA polymerase III epsilon subunit-like protein